MSFFDKIVSISFYSIPVLAVILPLIPFAIMNTIEENKQRKADELKMKEWGLK